MLKIAGIKFPSYVDGKGIRVVVFFSGCTKHCPGCHNLIAQNPDYGVDAYDTSQIDIIQMFLDRQYCSGLTISGGEPMEHAAEIREWLSKLDFQEGQDIWLYTGDEINDIYDSDVKYKLAVVCDYIVTGRFIEGKKTTTNGYYGSTNQQIWQHELNGTAEHVFFDVTNLLD